MKAFNCFTELFIIIYKLFNKYGWRCSDNNIIVFHFCINIILIVCVIFDAYRTVTIWSRKYILIVKYIFGFGHDVPGEFIRLVGEVTTCQLELSSESAWFEPMPVSTDNFFFVYNFNCG